MIRVIGGAYKGRRLKFIRSPLVRPMQDKLKGALFNVIKDKLPGSWFLDGFSGTGSVGIEALSRGAERVVFVDEFRPAVKAIEANVETCGAGDRSIVIHKEFNRAVIDLAKKEAMFDIVFLDPPYKLLETRNPLKVVWKRKILKPGGLLILRRYYRYDLPRNDFRLKREIPIGDDILAFLVLPETHQSPSPESAGKATEE
jgi:16S rRNA (guanine966-N2)-methyltransferase